MNGRKEGRKEERKEGKKEGGKEGEGGRDGGSLVLLLAFNTQDLGILSLVFEMQSSPESAPSSPSGARTDEA
jgi:predicted transposase YdaD